jgi:hypothetical protein
MVAFLTVASDGGILRVSWTLDSMALDIVKPLLSALQHDRPPKMPAEYFGPSLQGWHFATMTVAERSGRYLRAFLGRNPPKNRLSLKNLTLVLHSCQG